jgi:hypothetical protein
LLPAMKLQISYKITKYKVFGIHRGGYSNYDILDSTMTCSRVPACARRAAPNTMTRTAATTFMVIREHGGIKWELAIASCTDTVEILTKNCDPWYHACMVSNRLED